MAKHFMVPVKIWMCHTARGPVLGVAKSKTMHVGAPHISTYMRARASYVADHVLVQWTDSTLEKVRS